MERFNHNNKETIKLSWNFYTIVFFVAFLFVVLAYAHTIFGFYFWGVTGFAEGNDDAFISYRYALNWLEYGVLSFNQNDSPYVEGFSNPAHVALAIVLIKLFGAGALYFSIAVISIFACAVAIAMMMARLSERFGFYTGVGVGLSTALCTTLWVHSGSGLESGFVFFLQTWLWLVCAEAQFDAPDSFFQKHLLKLVVITALLVLFRTDGFVFPVICAVYLVIMGFYRSAMSIVAIAVLIFLSLMLIRFNYYGEILPNTVYSKVGGDFIGRVIFAAKLLGSMAYKNGLAIGFVALGIYALKLIASILSGRDNLQQGFSQKLFHSCRQAPVEMWLCMGLIAYYLLIGGDIYRDRFLIIFFPMSAALALKLVSNRKEASVSLAAIIILAYSMSFFLDPRIGWTSNRFDTFAEVGNFLKEKYSGATLATGAAGKIPFYSQLNTIDMLGLNNLAIARGKHKGNIPGHSKFDVDYVLSLKPDVICSHAFAKGDLAYGLDRARYQQAGYQLAWLVWGEGEINGQEPFIDVKNLSEGAVGEWISLGYEYAILERVEQVIPHVGR